MPGPCLERGWREKQDFLGDLETQFDYSQFIAPHEMGAATIYHVMLKQSNCLHELLFPREWAVAIQTNGEQAKLN